MASRRTVSNHRGKSCRGAPAAGSARLPRSIRCRCHGARGCHCRLPLLGL